MTIILAVHTLFFILLTSCSIVSPAPIPLFSKSGSAPIKESDVVNVPKTHNRTVHPFESIIPSQANSTSVVESGCQDNAADDSELPVVPSLGKRFSVSAWFGRDQLRPGDPKGRKA
ncbi:unnamed protein product [Somion occarium]|uniref:Uncharacterized protein n=1 Tax=Somion occarium TaxID=3059160 RepID=A0ABP1CPU3_9APHY